MFTNIVMLDHKRPLAARAAARKSCGPYRWTPSQPGKCRGFYSSQRDALEMDRAGSTVALRLEWANDHLDGSLTRTTGYYADGEQEGTLKPIIARLSHKRGFLAGWTMGEGMVGALDPEIHTKARYAALAAHSMAEHDAELEREAAAQEEEEPEEEEGEE